MAQPRDELGRFVRAAEEASDRLKGFARTIDEGTRAAANRERQEREAAEQFRNSLGVLGSAALGGLAAGGAAFAGRVAGAIQAGGDFGDALNMSLAGGIMALGRVPVIGNLLGATQAGRVLERAGGRVTDVTSDLARYGIEVSDEFRQDLVRTAVEQERRIENENQAVMSVLGDPDVIGRAGGRNTLVQGVGTFAEDIRELVNTVKLIADTIKSWLPGSS